MCEYLYEKSRYDELISLCDQSIIIYPEEERFYRYKLLAYMGMNTVKTALDYYQSSIDFFSSKYGMDISPSLRDIYQDILLRMPNVELKLDELETTLGVEKETDKTFYCNFDIFKNIYQLNVRSVRRSSGDHYLLPLTLLEKNGVKPDSLRLKELMDLLYDLLATNLRKNDVYTRASLNQYSVLVNVTDDIGIETVKERILESFSKVNRDSNIQLQIQEKPIE